MAGLSFVDIVSLFTIVILITATILSFYRFIQVRYRQFLYIALNWFGIAFWLILIVVQSLIILFGANFKLDLSNIPILTQFLDFFGLKIEIFTTPVSIAHIIGLIAMFSILPSILVVIFFVDFNRASIDPIKTGILGAVSVAFLITALAPGQEAGDPSEYTYFAQLLMQIFWSLLWILHAARLYIFSPAKYQKFAFVALVGTILAGVIPSFNTLTQIIPARFGVSELSFALGILLIAGTFLYQPRLLFIIPYKTSRLGVFNKKGVPLFSHQWISSEDDPIEELFFTEMREGISTILTESIKHKNVREIHLDKSILIINRYKDFSFVLLATQTSKSLITALNTFSVRFVTRFEELLAKGVYIDPKDHEAASEIVAESFPFLPS
ncbi:MAG: hypothetical protein ACFFDT_05630 [Candidatus Hodarchaeota archaeon]